MNGSIYFIFLVCLFWIQNALLSWCVLSAHVISVGHPFFFRSLLIYSFIEVFRLAKWIIDKASLTSVIMSVCVSQKAYCGHCSERIWGLGRQGYKCINCKLLVHKRCHKLVPLTCQRHMVSLSVSSKYIHHLSVVTEIHPIDLKA